MRRFLKFLPFVPYVLAAGFAAVMLLWRSEGGSVTDENGKAKVVESGEALIGGAFTLVDQNGVTRTERDFLGKNTLIFFGYTNCPDVCPTTLAVMGGALAEMGGEASAITPVFITVDPAHDTKDILKSYLAAFGPTFIGLTGSEEQVAQAAKAYRVYYQRHDTAGGGYTVDHSSVVYLMGPDGKYRANFTVETGPEKLAAQLKAELAKEKGKAG